MNMRKRLFLMGKNCTKLHSILNLEEETRASTRRKSFYLSSRSLVAMIAMMMTSLTLPFTTNRTVAYHFIRFSISKRTIFIFIEWTDFFMLLNIWVPMEGGNFFLWFWYFRRSFEKIRGKWKCNINSSFGMNRVELPPLWGLNFSPDESDIWKGKVSFCDSKRNKISTERAEKILFFIHSLAYHC